MIYSKLLEVLLAIGLIAGAWFYAGHRAVEQYRQEVALEQAAANAAQQARYETLAGEYETLKLKRAENARTIIKEVEKIVDRPIYSVQCLDTDGLRIANEAIDSANTRQHASAVSTTE